MLLFIATSGRVLGEGQLDGVELSKLEVEVPKFALVVGNGYYDHYTWLPHTWNDVDVIAQLFAHSGFDVVVRTELTHDEFVIELNDLRERVRDAVQRGVLPLVAVYFSGHGFAVGDQQYLVSIDFDYDKLDALRIVSKSISADLINASIGQTGTTLLFMDACRLLLSRAKNDTDSPAITSALPLNSLSTVSPPRGTKGITVEESAGDLSDREFLYVYANSKGKPAFSYVNPTDYNSPFSEALRRNMGQGGDLFDELSDADDYTEPAGQRVTYDHDTLKAHVYMYFKPSTIELMRQEWQAEPRKTRRWVWHFVKEYFNGPLATMARDWMRQHPNE